MSISVIFLSEDSRLVHVRGTTTANAQSQYIQVRTQQTQEGESMLD